MRNSVLLVVFYASLLAGCASKEPIAQSADPQTLALYTNADKTVLWKSDPAAPESQIFIQRRTGCATVGFLINSEGRPEDIAILKGYPNLGWLKEMAIANVEGRRYIPTDRNPNRVPQRMAEPFSANRRGSALDGDELRQLCELEGAGYGACRARSHPVKTDATADNLDCLELGESHSMEYESCMRGRGWSEMKDYECPTVQIEATEATNECISERMADFGESDIEAVEYCLEKQLKGD